MAIPSPDHRAVDADDAKSRLISLASHELRGPLTVITGHLSLLQEGAFGPVPDGFTRSFTEMQARVAEMETFINAMSDLARLEDGSLQLLCTDLDLRDVAREAVERAELYRHRDQRVLLREPETPVRVRADHARLLTLLNCLLHNAVKFSPQHTDVRVTVATRRGAATVSVSDDGIGIDPESHNVLFTRYGRVRGAGAALSGAGLGLYLARGIARAHGGDITVSSAAGAGSTFTLQVPAAA